MTKYQIKKLAAAYDGLIDLEASLPRRTDTDNECKGRIRSALQELALARSASLARSK
jgi:hypothetical protein